MGSVYLGRSATGEPVAIKVVRADYAADADFRRLFEREARIARRVPRFCTAAVLDSGDDGGRLCLVTEYIDGPTLHDDVRAHGPLDAGRLERLAVSVATALTAIHSVNAVHRDLKPSNVLLAADGARVIDFGIAVALDASTHLTHVVRGTPTYMAPEQASGRQPVGPPADIFAWGGVVVFAATGRPPFGTGKPEAMLYRVVHEAPDLTGVPEPLRAIVAEAMNRDPSRRPTAAELHHRLVTAAAPSSVTVCLPLW